MAYHNIDNLTSADTACYERAGVPFRCDLVEYLIHPCCNSLNDSRSHADVSANKSMTVAHEHFIQICTRDIKSHAFDSICA